MRSLLKNNLNYALSLWPGGLLGMLLFGASLMGQAQPANDNFNNAEIISGEMGSLMGSNVNATAESGEPNHANIPGGASVWYRWTAPKDGIVSFDTIGSSFNTLLAAYTGDNVNSLSCITANDNFDVTLPGPSAVKFMAAAGTIYKIAVDGFLGDAGDIVLNWAYNSAGTFQFTTDLFITSENELFVPILSVTTAPSVPTLITVTRLFGTSGRVAVNYTLTHDFYTNIAYTNIFGTNIFSTNTSIMPAVFTNVLQTNFSIVNLYDNNTRGIYSYCTERLAFNLTETNENGTITTSSNVLDPNSLTNIFCANRVTTVTDGTNTVVTQVFCTNILVTNIVAAAEPFIDYIPTSGTLFFDDFQMSTNFRVSVFPNDPSPALVNRMLIVTLTNAALDPLESPEISPARIHPLLGMAKVNVLDTDVIERTCDRTNTIFNFAKSTYRVKESVGTFPSLTNMARVFVVRSGTNFSAGATVQYRINFLPAARPDDNNLFDLQAGSDYATPTNDIVAQPYGLDPDFEQVTGTLTWGGNDGQPKPIDIPIINDSRVEFNEDLQLELFDISGGVTGNVARATLTILFDDDAENTALGLGQNGEQPAGAVDRTHNKDNATDTNPPFNSAPGANGTVYAVAVQPDGKTLVGGDFTAFNTRPTNRIARMNIDGSIDPGFNPGSGADGFVSSISLAPGGKIVIGGGFTSFNGIQRYGIARLNSNGSLDTTFNPGLGADGPVWSVVAQTDGKVLMAGEFTSVNGTNRNFVARLNSDGSLDTGFDPGAGPDGIVWSLAVQPSGGLLVGGDFMSVAGVSRSRIARLNSDGSLDLSFDPGSGADDTVFTVVSQPDSKVLIGGSFNSVNLTSRKSIARLNSNGSLDTTFNPGSGADDTVYSILLQGDGKVLVGGLFSSINQTRRVGVARLLPHGPVDTSFMDTGYNQFAGLVKSFSNPVVDPPNFVFALGLQGDGNVIIGGGFTRVGGGFRRDDVRNRSNVARLIGNSTPGPGNIEFAYDGYTADEAGSSSFITLVRTNGSLGPISVGVSTPSLPPGPGAAEPGEDFLCSFANPTFIDSWPGTRMLSDGIYGPNNGTITVINTPTNRVFLQSTADDLRVQILDDATIEGDENFNLELVLPNGNDIFFLGGENIALGTALGRSMANLTIADDDITPGVLGFSSPEYTVNENGITATITVTRTNGSTGGVTVQYATSNGSAIAGADYTARSGTLNFASGQTNRTFTIPITDDTAVESDETVNLRLFNPTGDATLGQTNATLTIVDNDFAPGRLNFSVTNYTADESAGTALITVTRNGGVGVMSVQYAVSNGTASNGSDFIGTTNTLNWNDGDITARTFTVPILDDVMIESNETVNLRLFNPSVAGALGSRTNAVLTLIDDDFFGSPNFSLANFTVNENGGTAIITVFRTGGSSESITVNFATSDGTAFSGADYIPTSGTLSFGPGETSKSFSVAIVDNPVQDGNRFLTVTLSSVTPSGAMLGSPIVAILTIIDNESFNEPAGSVDTSYSSAAGMNDVVYALALQNDGKLLAGGDFTAANNALRTRIARLNADGSLDVAFAPTGSGANGSVRALVSQTDGHILVGGFFTTMNGVNRNFIARLNLDGSLDSTFNPGSGADNPIFALAETFVGPNRKIIVGGAFTAFNGIARLGIARLNGNGMVDPGFNPGLGVNPIIYAVALQSNGKVIIGGDFTSVDGVARNGIARLNMNGKLDTSFDPGSGPNDSVRTIAIQTDGRVLLGGLFTSVNGTALNRIARLNTDGSVDMTFMPGPGANDLVNAIALQGDGKIVLGGQFTRASGVTRNRVTRLNADGTADLSINFGTGANSFVADVVIQPDAKIIIGGGFTEVDGQPRQHIARLHGGTIAGPGSFEFVSAQFTVEETTPNAVITVRRRGGTSGQASVSFATSDGTATAGSDYVGTNGTLVFPAGETFLSFTIPIIDDFSLESDETVQLTLFNPTGGATLGPQPIATLTILSDDSALRFSAPTYHFNENVINQVAILTVVRVGSSLGVVSVDFATLTNGTATPGVDFTPANGTLEFADGETNKTFTFAILNDTLVEGDETVNVRLTNPGGAFLLAPSEATVTIVDDEFAGGNVAFAAASFSVAENGVSATITVIRTNGNTGAITVDFATGGGTATPGLDYTPTSGTLVFGDGETTKTFTVLVLEDTLVEGNETVLLTLFNPTGGATIVGPPTVALTILDNDVSLIFSSPAYLVNESDGTLTITVLRQNGSNGVVTVQYATSNLTASAGSDYLATSGTLIFSDGETLKTFTIVIQEDTSVEGDETLLLTLSNPTGGAQLGTPSSATVTIVDNDAGIFFSSAAYSVNENGTNAAITVIRTNATSGTVSVNFATTDETATAGADYQATSATLVFTNGETMKTILIPIIDDVGVEGDETLTLSLSNPTGGAQLGDPITATLTIVDNDAGLRFSASTYSVSEGGVSATITVIRTNITTGTVTVDFQTSNGTATNGLDYVGTSGTLIFGDGETNKTFTVSLIDDTLEEGTETVLLTLSNPTGSASLVNPNAATLRIVDNDGALIVPAGATLTTESNPNGVIDPGETVTVLFALRNISDTDTTNLVATLLVTNGITGPSGPQSYGVLTALGPSVSRPFTFTANGTNGGAVGATFQLQDGPVNYGRVTFTFGLGSSSRSFTNANAIPISSGAPSPSPATPYPSSIAVSGLDGLVNQVTLTLSNLSHTFPDDIDILLVGPTGQTLKLMSDAGGANSVANITVTFDDAAPSSLPDSTPITTGTFRPTNYLLGDSFPAPAPPEPPLPARYGTTLSGFIGTNPNGAWSLFIVDDTQLDSGSIAGGWRLAITTSGAIASTVDLSVTMTDSPDPVIVSNLLTYTIAVTNHGPSAASGVILTNPLPAGVTFISANSTQGSCTNSAGTVTCNLGSLAKDASATVTLVVQPTLVGTINNTATARANESDANFANNSATATTSVNIPTADLAVSLVDAPDPVFVGANITYSATVMNLGPAPASGVRLTNTLPPGVDFVGASSGCTDLGGVVVCDLPTLANGTSATILVVVSPRIEGTINDTVRVGSSVNDPLKANNTASVKTIVELPRLNFARTGDSLVLFWQATSGFVLESTESLTPPINWTTVTSPPPQVVGDQNTVTFNPPMGTMFFRLRR